MRALLRRDAYDHELRDEAAFHLDLASRDATGPGDLDAYAVRRARVRFGNLGYLNEERRRAAGLHVTDALAMTLRHLGRSLRRVPGFTAVVVSTLALGIAITTTFVTIADHVLVRGLPFRDSGRLVMMIERDRHGGLRTPSAPTVADWQSDSATHRALEGVTYVRGDGLPLRVGADVENVGVAFVGAEFFPLLGVRPALGRVLHDDDHLAGAPRAVVVSHRLWQRRFAGDPSVRGRSIQLGDGPATVIGVLPRGAVYPEFADAWVAMSWLPRKEILQQRGFHADSRTVGRLRAGLDTAQAAALLRPVGERLAEQHPQHQAGWMPEAVPVRSALLGEIPRLLWTLAGAAAVVLLLACINVAGLLLARSAARDRELAVRRALGASRTRLAAQLLTENVALVTAGGVLGAGLAAAAIRAARTGLPDRIPRAADLILDARVLAIAAVATILTALLAALWPALRAARAPDAGVFRSGDLRSVGTRREARTRRALVAAQFALAVVLLAGAGLLLQSFRRAAMVDVGFDPRGLIALRLAPPAPEYGAAEAAAALYGRLMEAARAVPGVTDAAFINHGPFMGGSMITTVGIEGRASLDTSDRVFYRTVSASYLRTMRMSMAAGHWFSEDDVRAPGGRFVINQAMAQRYWPGSDPVGQRIRLTRASQSRPDFGQPMFGTIIGVVADVHQARQDAAPAAEVYVPYTLETWNWGMLVVRAEQGSAAVPAVVDAIAGVEPRLVRSRQAAISAFRSMDEAVSDALATRRFSTALVSAFAACALLLAAIGMYGAVAFSVTQRTRELGIRKALGATERRILTMLFRESTTTLAVGAAAGAAAGLAGAHLIRDLLFQTRAGDPAAHSATLLLLLAVSLLATYLPARRVLRLDPTVTLRSD